MVNGYPSLDPEPLRRAFEHAGFQLRDIEGAAGMDCAWMWDALNHPGELTFSVDLEHIGRLCRALGVDPAQLLGNAPRSPVENTEPETLRTRLIHLARATGFGEAAVNDLVGRDLRGFFHEARACHNWTFGCLVDVCSTLQLDWRGAFLSIMASAAGEKNAPAGQLGGECLREAS